ncbi:hypothetical protein N7U66_08600 [Lacinutrix neustonica]|uniref:Uncharacterized protein n=1 Tax=Lacinutrix neustonica TaxID=2980107 RepID=A0A9E8MXK1_9FLAO|nr:hypothetical protein [Lacinutrix neustonica]WAC03523.1 hypothetical protein N7U66_08600 [Lacinutrix neustonica]
MLLELSFTTIGKSIKYIELVTAILGTIYYHKYKHTFLKYFLLLLWYTTINGFLCRFLHENYILRNNSLLYNVYHLINFTFLFTLFRTYIKENIHKKWITAFAITYIACFFLNLIWQNYLIEIQTIPFIIGAVFIIISITFYFLEVLKTDKVLYVSKNLLFWISIGLLLYFVGKIPTRIVRNYWENITYYEDILIAEYILSIVMNICFIIGFICSKKDKQY